MFYIGSVPSHLRDEGHRKEGGINNNKEISSSPWQKMSMGKWSEQGSRWVVTKFPCHPAKGSEHGQNG